MTLTRAVEAGARAVEAELDRDMTAWVDRWTFAGGIYDDAPDPPKSKWTTSPERIAGAAISAALPIIGAELKKCAMKPRDDILAELMERPDKVDIGIELVQWGLNNNAIGYHGLYSRNQQDYRDAWWRLSQFINSLDEEDFDNPMLRRISAERDAAILSSTVLPGPFSVNTTFYGRPAQEDHAPRSEG